MWMSSYQSVVDSKLAERERLLALEDKGEVIHDAQITQSSASQIVSRIRQEEWTATQVLEAFIAKAVAAQARTNCVTEVLFEPARKFAKALDEEFASTKQLKGPLHGVPFSIKDQFEYEGYDTTIGFTQWAGKPATRTARLVKQLLALGAIPIVKSNVPQTMFAFECNNPLWGRTLNPFNKDYTCGGSSGGEAALLALDGACFGLGSDIAGSLRIPTAYCGLYSLKPTHGRLSRGGTKGPVPGFEGLQVVTGPIGRNIEDLELVCQLTFGDQDPTDYSIVPIPFRPVELPPKLHFGYYDTCGWVRASPAVKRAIEETVQSLRNAGHICTKFTPPNVLDPIAVTVGLTSADAYHTMLSHLGPDPLDRSVWLITFASRLPSPVRWLLGWVAKRFLGDSMFAEVSTHARKKGIGEYHEYISKRNAFNEEFYSEVWHKHGFDGIIAPVQALPQLPHGGCSELASLACETFVYNVVDSPVGVVPITSVDPERDDLTDKYTTGPAFGSVLTERRMYRGSSPWYNVHKMKGMPVSVQVVGKKWEEEKVLAMMKVVRDAVASSRE